MNWEKYLNAERLRSSERNKQSDPRNEFESDFGRVVFSPAIRRMHDKTQVFPLTSDDNIHSRLTHSLEVMSVGHSLGLKFCEREDILSKAGRDKHELLREVPVLLKNACLVHDIGNPPFGHFGETVIQDYFRDLFEKDSLLEKDSVFKDLTELERQDFEYFDGNAQGFRVLTKLQVLDDVYGLNLTSATLATYIKYPNTDKIDKKIISKKKRGVFQSEKAYLDKVFENCGLKHDGFIRHPLAYLMEAADSICYLVMDIEDGFNKGWYDYDFIKSELGDKNCLRKLYLSIEQKESEINKVVSLRIGLIKILVDLAIKNFSDNHDIICKGNYNKELIEDDDEDLAKTLSMFCKKNIFPKNEVQFLELTGHSVLTGLLNYYVDFIFYKSQDYQKRALGLISNSLIKATLLEKGLENNQENFEKLSIYSKLRIIVDFISGMTDQYALNHFQKLSGQKII